MNPNEIKNTLPKKSGSCVVWRVALITLRYTVVGLSWGVGHELGLMWGSVQSLKLQFLEGVSMQAIRAIVL